MLSIPTPKPGIYRRWVTALWGGIIAFCIVALTGFLILKMDNHFATDVEKLSILEEKIERGFNHYNLDELKEARELEQEVWVVPGRDGKYVGQFLFSIGTVTSLLLLAVICLQNLFRWIWYGKR